MDEYSQEIRNQKGIVQLKIGDEAPDFTLPSHLGRNVTLTEFRGKKNVVIAFYPLNWTPICSGQIPGYNDMLGKFNEFDTQVLAISVDSIPSHKSWAYSMGGIDYPILSDFWPHGEVTRRYGTLIEDEGYPERAIFIVDKRGIIRYIDRHEINQEPDPRELFRELEKLHKEQG